MPRDAWNWRRAAACALSAALALLALATIGAAPAAAQIGLGQLSQNPALQAQVAPGGAGDYDSLVPEADGHTPPVDVGPLSGVDGMSTYEALAENPSIAVDATQSRLDAFIRNAKSRLNDAPFVFDDLAATLGANSPTGDPWHFIHLALATVASLLIAFAVVTIVYGVWLLRSWFAARTRRRPQGYVEKLPILGLRFVLGLGGILLSTALGAVLLRIYWGPLELPEEQKTVIVVAVAYSLSRAIALMWRVILAPYLEAYRIPHLTNGEARRLFHWLWLTGTIAIAGPSLILWLQLMGSPPEAIQVLSPALGLISVVTKIALVMANHQAVSAAILLGRPPDRATWPARLAASAWGAAVIGYVLVAWTVGTVRDIEGLPHGAPLIVSGYIVLSTVLLVYGISVYAIEWLFFGRRVVMRPDPDGGASGAGGREPTPALLGAVAAGPAAALGAPPISTAPPAGADPAGANGAPLGAPGPEAAGTLSDAAIRNGAAAAEALNGSSASASATPAAEAPADPAGAAVPATRPPPDEPAGESGQDDAGRSDPGRDADGRTPPRPEAPEAPQTTITRPRSRMRNLHDLANRIATILALVAGALAIARIWRVDLLAEGVIDVAKWVDIGATLLIAYVVYHGIRIWIDQKIEEEGGLDPIQPGEGEGGGAGASRLATLLPLLRNFVLAVVFFSVLVFIALELGVNVAPLFAGAGIVGLALGFGAQALVRDILSGAFFLIDDAFRKGEYVDIGSVKGIVERISIRSFQLRHHLGYLHTVPFGEIQYLTNYSRDWVIMKLPIRLTYDTDADYVRKLVKKLGEQLLEHPVYGERFLQPLKSQGVIHMEDSAMIMRVKFMTRPGEQWEIRKLVYKEIRDLFQREGIKFAHREVTVRIADGEAAENLSEGERRAVGAAARRATEAQRQDEMLDDGPGGD